MDKGRRMQDLFKPESPLGGMLKWIWLAATFALIGLVVTPGNNRNRALTELIVAFFVAVAVAVFAGHFAVQAGASAPLAMLVCVMAALVGRTAVMFIVRLSHEIVTDDEIYSELAKAVTERLRRWIRNGRPPKDKEGPK